MKGNLPLDMRRGCCFCTSKNNHAHLKIYSILGVEESVAYKNYLGNSMWPTSCVILTSDIKVFYVKDLMTSRAALKNVLNCNWL